MDPTVGVTQVSSVELTKVPWATVDPSNRHCRSDAPPSSTKPRPRIVTVMPPCVEP